MRCVQEYIATLHARHFSLFVIFSGLSTSDDLEVEFQHENENIKRIARLLKVQPLARTPRATTRMSLTVAWAYRLPTKTGHQAWGEGPPAHGLHHVLPHPEGFFRSRFFLTLNPFVAFEFLPSPSVFMDPLIYVPLPS